MSNEDLLAGVEDELDDADEWLLPAAEELEYLQLAR